MAIDFEYRRRALGQLPATVGVYVLCDLDAVPIYVGQSAREGIRARVRRHLTSARSDIVANRQIDVWEIAHVWAYALPVGVSINDLESALFHHFHPQSQLMNGKTPAAPSAKFPLPSPSVKVQVMSDKEIGLKREPDQRLSRQANVYAQIVNHFLTVKNSAQIAAAMGAHFERLAKYHQQLLSSADGSTDD